MMRQVSFKHGGIYSGYSVGGKVTGTFGGLLVGKKCPRVAAKPIKLGQVVVQQSIRRLVQPMNWSIIDLLYLTTLVRQSYEHFEEATIRS